MKNKTFKEVDIFDVFERYKETVPRMSGIYVFYLKSCCLYVGRSVNLNGRIKERLCVRRGIIYNIFKKVKPRTLTLKIKLVEENNINSVEKYYINKLKPALNKEHNGYYG